MSSVGLVIVDCLVTHIACNQAHSLGELRRRFASLFSFLQAMPHAGIPHKAPSCLMHDSHGLVLTLDNTTMIWYHVFSATITCEDSSDQEEGDEDEEANGCLAKRHSLVTNCSALYKTALLMWQEHLRPSQARSALAKAAIAVQSHVLLDFTACGAVIVPE